MFGILYFVLICIDKVTVAHLKGVRVVEVHLGLHLDAYYAQKATSRRSTSGGAVTCADALSIVFL